MAIPDYQPVKVDRLPTAEALLDQLSHTRALLPLPARMLAGPLLDAFASYVVATDARIAALEARK